MPMKKLLIAAGCALLLTGCAAPSAYEVKVSESTNTLLTIDGVSISKQGYFESLLDNYGAEKIVADALEKIADKEVTDTKRVDKLVNDRKKVYEAYIGTTLDKFAKNLGYKDEAEFIEEALKPDAKQECLRNDYIKAHLDEYLEKYDVTRLKKIVVNLESEALIMIDEAKDEDAFDALMKKHEKNSEDLDIVTKNSGLDANITAKLDEFSKSDKDGVVSQAVKQTDGKFAVIFVYDTQKEDKQEYIDTLTVDSSIQAEIESIYLKKYNFNVYDEKLKTAIKNISSGYIE